MKKTIFLLAVLLCGFIFGEEAPKYWPLEIGGSLFTKIELAFDEETREKGLMDRDVLEEDGGMLFLFKDNAKRDFWMRNTRIPLDIIFLDVEGVVTAVHTMKVEPARKEGEPEYEYLNRLPSYGSLKPAASAIELNAGMAGMLGIKPGDKIGIFREQLLKYIK